MTEQQLLSIDLTTDEGKQELREVAGEVLIGEDNGHELNEVGNVCRRCFLDFRWPGNEISEPCKAKNKIPLTWQEAMKWRDWAVEKFRESFFRAMMEVMVSVKPDWVENQTESEAKARFMTYAVGFAQSEHYILAAVLCEYRSWPRLFFDGEGCNHKGCQNHISHPCEECGRTAAKGEIRSKGDN